MRNRKKAYSVVSIIDKKRLEPSGDVAQMVERSLSMREVRGSIPRISIFCSYFQTYLIDIIIKSFSFPEVQNSTFQCPVVSVNYTYGPLALALWLAIYIYIV